MSSAHALSQLITANGNVEIAHWCFRLAEGPSYDYVCIKNGCETWLSIRAVVSERGEVYCANCKAEMPLTMDVGA